MMSHTFQKLARGRCPWENSPPRGRAGLRQSPTLGKPGAGGGGGGEECPASPRKPQIGRSSEATSQEAPVSAAARAAGCRLRLRMPTGLVMKRARMEDAETRRCHGSRVLAA